MSENSYVRESLYDRIASDSNVLSGDEYRELVCAVAKVASDMVVKTLGPYGSTTVIDDGTGMTYPSKDGWACLSRLQFTDPTYNTIFTMLKKISFNSVTTVGDGTTTAMVAANNFLQAMYTEFMPKVTKEGAFRQADFIAAMNAVTKDIEAALTSNDHVKIIDPNGDFEEIRRIASVATNGNEEFATMIQNIYKETGNPHIQVVLDRSLPNTQMEIQTGYRFEARTLNFPFYINDTSDRISFKNTPVQVVVFDHNVTYQMHGKIITGLSAIANRSNQTVAIMAPHFDDIVATMIDTSVRRMAQQNQTPNIILIQIPTVMQLHRKTLSDLSVITGGQIFDEPKVKVFNILHHNATHDEENQIKDEILSLAEYAYEFPEQVLTRCLGTAKSMVITKTEGFIQDFQDIGGTPYKAILEEADKNYTEAKAKAEKTMGGTLDKEYLFHQMRYIKLRGSTGVIRVGGLSDLQARCDKDALDDAVLACRSAFENGYVRGMNLEILSILHPMYSRHPDDTGMMKYASDVIRLLYKSFYMTSLQVLMNKHPDVNTKRRVRQVSIVPIAPNEYSSHRISTETLNLCNIEVLDILITDPKRYDYNLRTEIMHSKDQWEVINSTATDIEILRAVVNVLTTVITSNQFLSVTRRYDPIISEERTIRNQMRTDARLATNKTNAIIEAITEHPRFEQLQSLFGGAGSLFDFMAMAGMGDDNAGEDEDPGEPAE